MRIGRNELCDCGSGKKYKDCCYSKHHEVLSKSIKQLQYEAKISYDRLENIIPEQIKFLKDNKHNFKIFNSLQINDSEIEKLRPGRYIVIFIYVNDEILAEMQLDDIETDFNIYMGVSSLLKNYNIYIHPTKEDFIKNKISLDGYKPSYYYLPYKNI